jgi:hypothetical protein
MKIAAATDEQATRQHKPGLVWNVHEFPLPLKMHHKWHHAERANDSSEKMRICLAFPACAHAGIAAVGNLTRTATATNALVMEIFRFSIVPPLRNLAGRLGAITATQQKWYREKKCCVQNHNVP